MAMVLRPVSQSVLTLNSSLSLAEFVSFQVSTADDEHWPPSGRAFQNLKNRPGIK